MIPRADSADFLPGLPVSPGIYDFESASTTFNGRTRWVGTVDDVSHLGLLLHVVVPLGAGTCRLTIPWASAPHFRHRPIPIPDGIPAPGNPWPE